MKVIEVTWWQCEFQRTPPHLNLKSWHTKKVTRLKNKAINIRSWVSMPSAAGSRQDKERDVYKLTLERKPGHLCIDGQQVWVVTDIQKSQALHLTDFWRHRHQTLVLQAQVTQLVHLQKLFWKPALHVFIYKGNPTHQHTTRNRVDNLRIRINKQFAWARNKYFIWKPYKVNTSKNTSSMSVPPGGSVPM